MNLFVFLFDLLALCVGILQFIFYYIIKFIFKKQDDEHCKKSDYLVLFLHGSGFNESQWMLYKWYLRRSGKGLFHYKSMNYAYLFSNKETESIQDLANRVWGYTLNQIEKHKYKKVIFVGHSMGGLIASSCLSMDHENYILCIITIASPWKGSCLLTTKKSLKKTYQEMTPGSAFLSSLQQQIVNQNHVNKIICIGSDDDWIVGKQNWLPSFSSVLKIQLSWFGHYSILFHPVLINSLLNQEKFKTYITKHL